MTAKELAHVLGISTEHVFQDAYERFGRLYSIGGPAETHARYLRLGYIPIYVARYVSQMERAMAEPAIDA